MAFRKVAWLAEQGWVQQVQATAAGALLNVLGPEQETIGSPECKSGLQYGQRQHIRETIASIISLSAVHDALFQQAPSIEEAGISMGSQA